MRRRLLLTSAAWVASASLGACGFALRQAPEFAFQSLYINASPTSPLVIELMRHLASSPKLRVITDTQELQQAQAILDILTEQREKSVLALNASGQVRDFTLRYRVRFKLRTLQGKELIEPAEILVLRTISYSETQALSKETEEAMLYKNMQTDAVQQLVRRLDAVPSL